MTSIPGVAQVFERSDWEPPELAMATAFFQKPPSYVPGAVTREVSHWTGAANVPDGDPGETQAQVLAWLARSTKDYLENRDDGGYRRRSDNKLFPGYPLGYSFAVDAWGAAYVIRGWDFRPAATNGHNGYTNAVLFFIDSTGTPTPQQWETFRCIGRETRRRSQRADFNPASIDHGTAYLITGVGTPTACAGPAIRSLMPTQGNIDFQTPPETGVPPMATLKSADQVRLLDTRDKATFPNWGRKVAAGENVTILVPGAGPGAKPDWAGAARIRLTAVETEAPGFAQAWVGTGVRSDVQADLNWDRAGAIEADRAEVELNGFQFKVFCSAACHLVVELKGYDSII